jgi:hypothetical protein
LLGHDGATKLASGNVQCVAFGGQELLTNVSRGDDPDSRGKLRPEFDLDTLRLGRCYSSVMVT